MNIEIIEKELTKYKGVATNLEKSIAVTEDRLEQTIDILKREFNVETLNETNALLEGLTTEINDLEQKIASQMEELRKNYGHLK